MTSVLLGALLACSPLAAAQEPAKKADAKKVSDAASAPSGKTRKSGKAPAKASADDDKDEAEAKKEPPKKVVRLALRGATVLVGDGRVVEGATILIEDGKIAGVGRDVKLPAGTPVRNVSGKFVYPGLIDAGSSIGLAASDRDARKNGLDIADGLDPFDRDLERAVAGGVTAAFVSPRHIAPVTGTLGAVIKLRAGANPADFVLASDCAVRANIGVSNGRTSNDVSRFKTVEAVPKALKAAKSYRESKASYEEKLAEWKKKLAEWRETNGVPVPDDEKPKDDDEKAKKKKKKKSKSKKKSSKKKRVKSRPREPKEPKVDRVKEALLDVLDRKIPLRVEAHRAADIRHALDLVEAHGIRLVIEGGTEAARFAKELAKAKVAVVAGPLAGMDPSRLELAHFDPDALAALDDVRVALRSGTEDTRAVRHLPMMAAHAAGCGLGRDRALRAITLDAARVLGVDDRIGSIEVGKDADLVVADRHPFDTASTVLAVLIDGKAVFGGTR